MSTETKVKQLVKDVLPRGKAFRLHWQPVGFGPYRVLRVITPAWRSLSRFERILKVQKAITAGLGPNEREDILRVSVLTADEYKRLHPALLPSRSVRARARRQSANGKPIRLRQ